MRSGESQPAKEKYGDNCPGDLRQDEPGGVRGTDAGKRIAGRASQGHGRVGERRRRSKPVGRGNVGANGESNRGRTRASTSPDHGEQTEGGDEFAPQKG